MRRVHLAPPRTIRGLLYALIVIALTPLVAVGVYAVVDEYRDQRDAEVRDSAELARTVAATLEAFVRDVLRTEYAVAAAFAVHGHGPEQIREELVLVQGEIPSVADMSWIDPRGVVLASTEPGLVGKSLYASEYFQDMLAGAESRVSPLVSSLVDGRPVFVVARAFRPAPSETLASVIVAAVDADRLGPLLGGVRSRGGRTTIVDSAGVLVAAQPPPPDLDWDVRRRTIGHPWFVKALQGEEALGIFRSPLAGERRVGAVVPVRGLGWAAHASRPLDEAMAPVLRTVAFNAAALVAVALAALGAALLVARGIAGPLRALEAHAVRLGRDGELRVSVRGPAEVRRVARALEQMAATAAERRADLEAVNRQLADGEERSRSLAQAAADAAAVAGARSAELEAVVAALPVGLVIVDPAEEPIRINESAREILGLTPEGAMSPAAKRARVLRVLGANGRVVAADVQPLARALRGDRVRGEVFRVDREGGDASPVWISVSAAPVRDDAGAIRGAVAAFVDITQLRSLQEERETLMQTVSHDLRTPLHVIVGHAEILRRRGDDEAHRRAEAILGSAGRMTRLIGDLVDAARLETGHVALRLEPMDLVAFLAAWRERMVGALAMERVRLSVPETAPAVLADPARLDQILVNLVSNALKYSVAGSEVLIDLRVTPSELRLSVADQGPGISPDELPRLFERYYRASSAARAEGLGLGLFIARKLVDAHGWRIEAVSELGTGSVFTLVVPVAGGRSSRSSAA